MKKICMLLIVIGLLVPVAQGFAAEAIPLNTSKAQIDGKEIIPSTQSSTITVEEMRAAIKAGAVAAAKPYKKVAEKATTTAKESVEVAKKSTKALEDSTKTLKDNQGLMQELTDSNTTLAGAVTELGKDVGSIAGETAKSVRGDLIWTASAICLLICIIGILLVIVVRKTKDDIDSSVSSEIEKVTTNIKNIPSQTAVLVKKVEPYQINIPDIKGKAILFKPEIVDEMYKSLYVPKTVSGTVDDPKKIVRVPMTDKGRLYRSTHDVIADWIDGVFDGDDPHPTQQRQVLEYLKDAGILVIS